MDLITKIVVIPFETSQYTTTNLFYLGQNYALYQDNQNIAILFFVSLHFISNEASNMGHVF